MCEGGGVIVPIFDPCDLIPNVRDRRGLLKPLEVFGWQRIRKESKGKLFEIRNKIAVWRLVRSISDLSNISCEDVDSGYALIISYIPIRFFYSRGAMYDSFAFVILYKESYYLLPLSSMEPWKHNPEITHEC